MGHRYDMVVIGAGPAGEKAANQAAYFGKSVVLVDRSETPGGTAVSLGGVPTKTLRDTALYVTGFRRRDVYGVSLGLDPDVIVRHLRARAEDVVANMAEVVRENLEHHRVAFVRGEARLAPGGRVMVETAGGGTRELEAPVILVATGSHPFHPPDVPFEDPDVLDSDTVLDLDRPFSDLVVVGGGAVGCEYASIFTALGVRVTLVDRAPRLLPFMDEEISHLLADAFRDAGMRVLLGTGGAAIRRDDEGLLVAVRDAGQGDDGEGEILRPDKVLFAAGRAGDVRGLGLADVGVDVDERGRIVVDGRYRTSAPGIWAAGDVIGPPALASVSMEQGRVAACYAFDIPFKRTVDPLPPFGVYSIPEASMVGMTEQQAAAAGLDHETGRGWFARNTRARIAGSTEGLVKLVFGRGDRRLLGVHALGDHATELIHVGQAVLHFGGTIDHFIHTTFNVPTETEAYKYAAYDGLQRLAAREGGALPVEVTA